jgi:protein involved in polysaccharide export with SLBB domain
LCTLLGVAFFLVLSSMPSDAQMQSGSSTATSFDPAGPAAQPTMDPGYHLGTGDQIHLTVYNETDLSGDYSVDDRGFVRLPLIGEIKAQGLTLIELEQTVEAKFSQGYLKSPKISVQITNYRPFYIIGEVNKPGQYPFVNGMNAVTAVAIAGGYTYRADDSDIYIRRSGASKEESEPADQTTKIEPGDIIRVAERFF